MDTSSAAILIRDVAISYDKTPAVYDINLEVKSGELFGLIGLNGAGKTTMIKALLNLRNADKGQMQIFGKPQDAPESKKRLAFLPERFEPSWFLSGQEFLDFSARLYGVKVSDEECRAVAERLALDPAALKRRVQTYSKGMRQKLGLMATVMTGCDLLILDEPMSGLDPIARALVKNYLLEAKGRGCTIFLSSHILADMEEICDRVAVLYDKTIRFTGTPAQFRELTSSPNLERAFLHFIEKRSAA